MTDSTPHPLPFSLSHTHTHTHRDTEGDTCTRSTAVNHGSSDKKKGGGGGLIIFMLSDFLVYNQAYCYVIAGNTMSLFSDVYGNGLSYGNDNPVWELYFMF